MGQWANRSPVKETPKANSYFKECLRALAIMEVQIKTTLRFHLTPIQMAVVKNANADSCAEEHPLLEGV